MSNNNGKITAPISQADIKSVLGISTNSLAAACQSANINEKAAYKPIYISSYEPLTVEQRKKANYGTFVNQYNNPILLIRAMMQGLAWGYSRPPIQLPFIRRLDFDGYNHNAGDWMQSEIRDTSVVTNQSLSIELVGNGDALPEYNPLMELLNLGYLADYDLMDLNFGYLLRNSQFSESTSNCYYIPLTGTQTIRDMNTVIPANVFTSAGTWYLLPVLTTATYTQGERVYFSNTDSVGGTWWPIPYSTIASITVVAPTYPVDKFSASVYDNSQVTIDSATYRVTVPSLTLAITNGNTSAYEVTVKVVPSENYIHGSIISGSFATKTITVAAGATVNINVVGSTAVWETMNNRALIDIELYVDGKSKTTYQQLIGSGRE